MKSSTRGQPKSVPQRKPSMSLWGKFLWSMFGFAARQLGLVFVDIYAPGVGDERRVRGITFADDESYVEKVRLVEAESKVTASEWEGVC